MRTIVGAFVLALATGCSSTYQHNPGAAIQPAMDVPTHFLVPGQDGKLDEPAPGECRNPLVDPRDGTKIILVRSAEGRGYYKVPEGRYGVRPGEVLLIECGTGRVMGVVKR